MSYTFAILGTSAKSFSHRSVNADPVHDPKMMIKLSYSGLLIIAKRMASYKLSQIVIAMGPVVFMKLC